MSILGFTALWVIGGSFVALIAGKLMGVGSEADRQLLDVEIYEGSAGSSDAGFPVGFGAFHDGGIAS